MSSVWLLLEVLFVIVTAFIIILFIIMIRSSNSIINSIINSIADDPTAVKVMNVRANVQGTY